MPLLVGLEELVDGRRVEAGNGIVLEREQRPRSARLEPFGAGLQERLHGLAEAVQFAALHGEHRVLRLRIAVDHLEFHAEQPAQQVRRLGHRRAGAGAADDQLVLEQVLGLFHRARSIAKQPRLLISGLPIQLNLIGS